MPASSAVITFVGIIVFSNQLATDGHLRALMPRIPKASPGVMYSAARSPGALPGVDAGGGVSKAASAMALTQVEEHWGFIAFKTCDYISSKGWAPTGLEALPGYLYVRLDGEQIRFAGTTTPPPNPTPSSDRRQPLPNDFGATLGPALNLPHMQPCCEKPGLWPEYLPPRYELAEAVFDLSTATRVTNGVGENTNNRADTMVTVANNGVLEIVGSKNGKEKVLRLNGTAQVMVGHLPPDFILGGSPKSGPPHCLAYSAMLVVRNSTCAKRAGCDATAAANRLTCDAQYVTQPPNGTGHSHINIMAREGIDSGSTTASDTTVPGDIRDQLRFDEQCSNTQWP
jgi:hypothetical protein